MERIKLNKRIKIKAVTKPLKHHFFGYYDRSPWNKTERFMLAMEANFNDHFPPRPNETVKIGIIDLKNKNKFIELSESKAWSWQQGSMLQWLPPDYNRYIIFNDRRKNKFVSIIFDIKTKKEKVLPFPVYDIHPNGRYALSLNFSRLNDLRPGYGYNGLKDKYEKEKYPEKDGIYLIDLEKKKQRLLISLKQLKQKNYLDSMEKGKHWVEHLSFSPDGQRFVFSHRWKINQELFHTRLYTADLDGKNLFQFPDSGYYSHIVWKDSKHLFGWGSISEKFGSIRRDKKKIKLLSKRLLPIYRRLIPKIIRKKILPIHYFLLTDQTSQILRINLHDEDGHPTFSPDKKWVVTDTYPDKKHYRTLILYNFTTRKKITLGKVYSLPEKKDIKIKRWDYVGIRCDLHPRWNRKGDKICIDSVHEGTRQMYVLDLSKLVK